MQSTHQLVNHYRPNDSLSQYGDGVFETLLAVGNRPHHWDYHWRRLQQSCQRLQIALPAHDMLHKQLSTALQQQNNDFSVVKLLVSRGDGLRGYRSLPQQPCYVQFSIAPYVFNPQLYQGLSVRVCQTRLAYQPLLAGMKHLNRLEYVMARRESDDALFDEGLLLDYDNRLIEGLISNIFIIRGQQIMTPNLTGSGVAGTMRAYLLKALPTWGWRVSVDEMALMDIANADAVFLSNATGGIMPVKRIQGINKDFIDKDFDVTTVNTIRQQAEHPCSEL